MNLNRIKPTKADLQALYETHWYFPIAGGADGSGGQWIPRVQPQAAPIGAQQRKAATVKKSLGIFDLAADNSLHVVGCALFGLVILALPFALLVYYLGPVLADLLAGELGAAVVITMVATPVIWIVSRQIAAVLVARAEAKRPPPPIFPPAPSVEIHRGYSGPEMKQLLDALQAQQPKALPSGTARPLPGAADVIPTRWVSSPGSEQPSPGQVGAGVGWKR